MCIVQCLSRKGSGGHHEAELLRRVVLCTAVAVGCCGWARALTLAVAVRFYSVPSVHGTQLTVLQCCIYSYGQDHRWLQ